MGKTTWCNECEQYFAGVTHLCWRSSSAPEDVPAYLLANPIPRAKAPDPRDARIAELESALAGLVDRTRGTVPKLIDEARAPATCPVGHDCGPCRGRRMILMREPLRAAIEAAERALGRRK